MYNHQIKLITRTFVNDGLQETIKEESIKVLCKVQSVKRFEFYKMREADLKPEVVFIVKGYEYDDQDTIEYNGKRYRVVRTYQIDYEELELVCERLTSHE